LRRLSVAYICDEPVDLILSLNTFPACMTLHDDDHDNVVVDDDDDGDDDNYDVMMMLWRY
jgi:hypothetical protein